MTRIEQKLIAFITRFFPLILLVVVSVIGALLRIQGMSFQSMDYHYYLHPWWETIKAQGWQVVTIYEMFAVNGKELKGGQIYKRC